MHRRDFIGAVSGAAALGIAEAAFAASPDLETDARNAWLYVLPLIEMAAARIRMTDTSRPGQHAGINFFRHSEKLAGPEDRGVTTPNNDTLYSNSFIDLTNGPLTLTVPKVGSRYLSVAVMDMFTNNNVILGARTPGGAAGTWRLIGPDMKPTGPRDLQVKTPHAWVLSRVLLDGLPDMAAAQKVQHAVALSGPKAERPRVYAHREAPWSAYFQSAAELLKSDGIGTAPDGLAAFERVKNAGRSKDFAASGYSAADAAAIAKGVESARKVVETATDHVSFIDGWSYLKPDVGDYGDDYVYRAIIAVLGLGALTRPEAMYMRAASEAGSPLFQGDGLYRLNLSKPIPVNSFWSLTMYEATRDGQYFLTENVLNRYAVGDRTPGLKRNADGSLDIWIGRHDPGGERTSNWLPAPKSGPFSLFMRAYLPQPELQNLTYHLPPVTKA